MVVDFAKLSGDTAFLKKAMAKFGITLSINDAIASMSATIRDHEHFQRLITEAEPSFRQSFYDSVRPHLKFRAKPLDVYIADAQQMAEREKLPTLMPDGTLREFRPASDVESVQKAMAASIASRHFVLTCSKCTKQETFYAVGLETPVAVIMKARKVGWMYDPVLKNETCPNCVELWACDVVPLSGR